MTLLRNIKYKLYRARYKRKCLMEMLINFSKNGSYLGMLFLFSEEVDIIEK